MANKPSACESRTVPSTNSAVRPCSRLCNQLRPPFFVVQAFPSSKCQSPPWKAFGCCFVRSHLLLQEWEQTGPKWPRPLSFVGIQGITDTPSRLQKLLGGTKRGTRKPAALQLKQHLETRLAAYWRGHSSHSQSPLLFGCCWTAWLKFFLRPNYTTLLML